jgi:hypothetical protein
MLSIAVLGSGDDKQVVTVNLHSFGSVTFGRTEILFCGNKSAPGGIMGVHLDLDLMATSLC